MALRDLGFPRREPGKPFVLPPSRPPRYRLLAWIAGALLLLVIVVTTAIYAVLHSASFHNFVLHVAEQKATASLNTRVKLQNFAFRWSKPGLDLYGLTVDGTGAAAGAPLLQVDHIEIGVRITSVLHRQWTLDSVVVDRPVVNLTVTPAGQSNLPVLQSNGASNVNAFDLAIGRVLLDRGEVYYNDHKSVLNADLTDLDFQSGYDSTGGGRYLGSLSYRDGHLQYGTYAPVPHDLSTQFDARRGGVSLSNLALQVGQSQLRLNANLADYASPRLHATYMVNVALGELRTIMSQPAIPDGAVLINGTADYSNVAGKQLLDTISLQGTIRSRVLRLRTASLRTDIQELNSQYSVADGNAELRGVIARLLGGELRGAATLRDLSGKRQGHVAASLHNISLADLKTLTNSASLRPLAISGRVNAATDAAWSGSLTNLVARANVAADGSIGSELDKAARKTILPLKAAIQARYNGPTQEITVNQSYLQTPRTSVTLDGTISKRSALQVRVHANDLHELETVARIFGKPGAEPLELHGTASFEGTVRGSASAPEIDGQLNASNIELRGSTFRLLRTSVQANPFKASLQNGVLDLGKQGHVSFNLQAGLHDWSYTPSSPFLANVNAAQLSLAELAHAMDIATPVSGTLNASVTAHGTQLNPIGQGDLKLRNASLSGEPVQLADVSFQGTGDAVHADLQLRLAAGAAEGRITYYPKQQGYDAALRALNIHLEQLHSLQAHNLQTAGTLNLTANGRGTLENPQGTVSLTVPQLTLQKQQIQNVNFQGNIANHDATFSLSSQVLNTPLRAQGKVSLAGDYYADATLDTPKISLQPLLAVYAPSQAAQISGQTEIHASVRGPLKKTQLLEVHLNVPTLAVEYRTATAGVQQESLQVAAVNPIRVAYTAGVLTLQPSQIKGTDTDLRFQGRVPLNSNEPSTLNVQGAVDLAIARLFDPTLRSSGQLQLDINAGGHRTDPTAEGQIRIVNASFSTPDAPVGLSDGNGVLTLRRDRLDITQFTGNVGGGPITASGGVAYRPALQFNIAVNGSDVRLLYPRSVRSNFGLNLSMTGNTEAALLQGQVNVNRVSFTPDFDLSSFMSQFSGVSSQSEGQGFTDNLKLNIAVRSTAELNVVSPTVSIQGDANLRVIGTAADPVIVGRASLSGGDIIFLGNRYSIQGGTIAFVNTIETEPVLNLQASTTIQQYNIALRFRGPLDRLQTNYTSNPALSQADIIHLLAFGNTEEAANAAPAQSTTLGAESLVASQVSGQVTSRLQKALGVSQISVDPQLGAATGNQPQGARLTVQQRVTSKLFVTFSTDVTSTQNTAIQMQYQLNRKWSVSAVGNQNGGFGLDGRYRKDF